MQSALPSELSPARPRPRALSNWLLAVAFLVFVMVVVGGITRLTESGLSITEWRPISGAVPPLNASDWAHAFELYKATPEYRQVNGPAGMNLAAFQQIYFWEWLHRFLGRLVGLAFAVPLAWFAWRRTIPRGYGWKMVALLVLGAAQGVLGWYMVMSGLAGRTDVSHLRLSAHLLLALAIMGALIWVALDLRKLAASGQDKSARLTRPAAAVLLILTVQILTGAWVAGLDAGQVASTWPDMNGRFVPDGIDWSLGPAHSLSHDPFLVHFIHRWWAWATAAALVLLALRIRRLPDGGPASLAILAAAGIQVLLGIATVLTGVVIGAAALHQAVGALLVAATVRGAHLVGQRQ